MRTREEQIESACEQIKQARTFNNVCNWLSGHILEAERRAEQRVLAEIGRDSERLDWLAGVVQSIHRTSNMPTQWILEFRTKLASFDRDDLRQAIDAAMETK